MISSALIIKNIYSRPCLNIIVFLPAIFLFFYQQYFASNAVRDWTAREGRKIWILMILISWGREWGGGFPPTFFMLPLRTGSFFPGVSGHHHLICIQGLKCAQVVNINCTVTSHGHGIEVKLMLFY